MVPTTGTLMILPVSMASQRSRRFVLLSLYLLRIGQRLYINSNYPPNESTIFGQKGGVIVCIELGTIAKRVSCIKGDQ